MKLKPLDAAGRNALADALGDSPWAATAAHLLHRGLCTAYVEGDSSSFAAAVVFWDIRPERAVAFGSDVEALWQLLQVVQGWRLINVAEAQAPALGAAMERDMRRRVSCHWDTYHILTGPSQEYAHPLVRRLTVEDIALIEEAPPFLQQGRLFGGPLGLLREGIIAGAIDSGRVVATAHTATLTDDYADIGVATLEAYRRQGIAAAAASLVCREVQATSRTPVWDCSEENLPSLCLAQKLGFVSIGRRVDLVPVME